MSNYIIVVNESQDGLRLDIFLSQNINDLSRNKIQNLVKNKAVSIKINNKLSIITDCNYKVNLNEEIHVNYIRDNKVNNLEAYNFPLNILYEDEYLLVLNKPAGLVVHPGAGNVNNTLVNALISKYNKQLSTIGGGDRPGIVHRLDKDTSGVLLIAKTDESHSKLSKQFAEHSIVRSYRALVWGVISPLSGIIDNIIGRSSHNRQKMAVLNNKTYISQGQPLNCPNDTNKANDYILTRGKKAITIYNTLKVSNNKLFSLIDCSLKTGRTHQIRVHFSNIGHPVVADKLYGKKISEKSIQFLPIELVNLNRQALHAYKLEFVHPITNEQMNFEVPEEEELLRIYNIIFNNET